MGADAFIVERRALALPLPRDADLDCQYEIYTPQGLEISWPDLTLCQIWCFQRMLSRDPLGREVVEEIAGFPFMSHDDLVDSTVMALGFRRGLYTSA